MITLHFTRHIIPFAQSDFISAVAALMRLLENIEMRWMTNVSVHEFAFRFDVRRMWFTLLTLIGNINHVHHHHHRRHHGFWCIGFTLKERCDHRVDVNQSSFIDTSCSNHSISGVKELISAGVVEQSCLTNTVLGWHLQLTLWSL